MAKTKSKTKAENQTQMVKIYIMGSMYEVPS